MSNEAPERIWAAKDRSGIWDAGTFCTVSDGGAPYIREDLHTAEVQRLQERVRELEGALEWYAETVADCRKITGEGDDARHKLYVDQGSHARAALNREGGE